MRTNRFITAKTGNNTDVLYAPSNRFIRKPQHNNMAKSHGNGMVTPTPSCPQVSTDAVEADIFILDVLEIFFQERLTSESLNDALRRTAAVAVYEANNILPPALAVPAPPEGRPTAGWLTAEAVQTAFRRTQNGCHYLKIRNTIRQRLLPQYEADKNAAIPLAASSSYYAGSFGVNNLTVSQAGIDLIKEFEGFRANLYNDVAGHCTIGYGTLVHRDNCNGSESEEFRNGISDQRATELLMQEINSKAAVVNDAVNVTLNQNQFDALVSFVYNIGAGSTNPRRGFRGSTLLRKLNEGDYASVPTELRKWVKAGGRTVQGLVNRREREAALFTRAVSTGQSISAPCGCGGNHSYTHSYGNTATAMQTVPRGIRNNNPGNIEMNAANDWEGRVPLSQNTDGRFEQFTSFAYGVRALIILLRNYIRGGRNTITRIFEAYAPPAENNTQNYIRFVSERIGISATDVVPLTRNNVRTLAQAIARMENGVEAITDQQFDEGWALVPSSITAGLSLYGSAFQNQPIACLPDAAFNTKWTTIKNLVVTVANEEFTFWTKPDGTRYPETDPFVTERMKEYWNIVGVNPSTANIQSATWQDAHPWSAAFISWVMYTAQARERLQSFPTADSPFRIAAAHTVFAHAAKQNTLAQNYDNPFWLCEASVAIPEPGDIIVRNRAINGVMGTITYNSLNGSGSSHSDIVTAVDRTANRLTVTGGNKTGNSVNHETYRLTATGLLDLTHHTNIIGILKLRADKCSTC
jgi:GH24 family phage-related lysozyme (muramidase)